MRTLAPSAAATNACVSVAMPDRCCRKFSAVRSPASSAAAGPRTVATTPPAAIGSPSDTFMRTRVRQSKRVKTASTTPSPHTTARSRAMISASASCVSSITEAVVDVAAADVLLQRQVEQPLHGRRVPGRRVDAHARTSRRPPTVGCRQSCTGQPRRFAIRRRRGSGLTTTWLPTRSSIGMSVYESV